MKYLVSIYFLIVSTLVYGQVEHNFEMGPDKTDCHTVSQKIDTSSLENTYKTIKNAEYRFKQDVKFSRYRSPKSGEFYSCDGDKGFMILNLKDGDREIFAEVSKEDWDKLSETNDPFTLYSSGYYDSYRILLSKN